MFGSRRGIRSLSFLLAAVLSACSAAFERTAPCTPLSELLPLPPEVPESSGVEPSSLVSDVYWTHNDSGWDETLFAVDHEGRLVGTVRVRNARNRDWEDLAAGPCDEGVGRCLYIADTGDNRLDRSDPAVYRIPEPHPLEDSTAVARRFPVRFPHGPRDVEALFVLPEERLFFVTKGRAGPVELYRYPGPLREGEAVGLERIQTLTDRAPLLPDLVTGAAVDAAGEVVAIRTYHELVFHRPDEEGRLTPMERGRARLAPLGEPQGEAVAFLPDGALVLTTEAGPLGRVGGMAFLRCSPGG